MKVGDLVEIDFKNANATIVGVLMSQAANHATVYVIRTPTGKFVGEHAYFPISMMKVISESR